VEHAKDWPKSVAKQVGQRVAYFRARATDERGHKLTAQGLSDRCKALGLELGRPTIAKLEKGLRETITVGELIVLARALSVSPADLVFPIGQAEVELLPGYHLETWKAVLWFAGFSARPGRTPPAHEASEVPLYQVHHQLLQDWTFAGSEHRRTILTGLRGIREDMRERGLLPPELPEDVAAAVNGEPGK